MSKDVLPSDEANTIGMPRNGIVIMTHNGFAESTKEATVNDHDLDMFVTVVLLASLQAVLLLVILCDVLGHYGNWNFEKHPS